MNLDDYLASYQKKFDFLEKLVNGLVNTDYIFAALVSGSPGIGKTYTIDRILEAQQSNTEKPILYKRMSGKITPLAFYNELRENSASDCVLFFDDADTVITNPEALNLLKSATERRSQRIITYNSTQISDKTCVFEGKIIISTNLKMARNPHFEAINDRFHVYDMDISYRERLAKIFDLAKRDEEHTQVNAEVITYLLNAAEVFTPDKITLRTFKKMQELALLMPDDWKDFIKFSGTYYDSRS